MRQGRVVYLCWHLGEDSDRILARHRDRVLPAGSRWTRRIVIEWRNGQDPDFANRLRGRDRGDARRADHRSSGCRSTSSSSIDARKPAADRLPQGRDRLRQGRGGRRRSLRAAGDFHLIETVAELIAARVLAEFPTPQVRVLVRKISPVAGAAGRLCFGGDRPTVAANHQNLDLPNISVEDSEVVALS